MATYDNLTYHNRGLCLSNQCEVNGQRRKQPWLSPPTAAAAAAATAQCTDCFKSAISHGCE